MNTDEAPPAQGPADAGGGAAHEPPAALHGRLLNVSRMATIGEMAAGVAHELNQPLTAIANYAQACDRHHPALAHPGAQVPGAASCERRETLW